MSGYWPDGITSTAQVGVQWISKDDIGVPYDFYKHVWLSASFFFMQGRDTPIVHWVITVGFS